MLPSERRNWRRASERRLMPLEGVRPDVVPRGDAVELVRGLLEWTGWSQARFAAALREVAKETGLPTPGVDAVTVNRWVAGKQCPTSFYVRLLVVLLTLLLSAAAHDPWLASKLGEVRRRQFLLRVASAAGLSTLVPTVGSAVPGLPAFLDELTAPSSSQLETAAAHFGRILADLDAADSFLGPRLQLPAVVRYYELIENLVQVARGAVRTELLQLRTRYAEFAGWLYQDSGDTAAAAWWTDRAMESATETDDVLMTAFLLARRSWQAAVERDARTAIELAQAAQQPHPLLPTIRAFAAEQEAYGLALAGHGAAAERVIDDAIKLADQRSDDDALGPARFCIPQEVQNRWAACLLELGQPGRAIEAFERGLAELPPTHYRNRGVFLGQLAVAYAVQGIPDAAVSYGRQAHEAARATASGRIFGKLQELRPKLRTWANLPVVAEFQRELDYFGRDT